jgi:GT2 family glycosyltransferase
VTIRTGSGATSTVCSPSTDAPADRLLTVTVIICAYTEERWDQLAAAVASVRNQPTAADQVVVVVDHNDELLERAEAAFADIDVCASTGPRGLSGARNTGLAASRGDIVAFLDDDAEAGTGWLERLRRHYDDPAVIGVGGRALPRWDGRQPRWFPDEFLWVVGCSFAGQPTSVTAVRNMLGCNMSFRRTALDRADGFHPALGRVGKNPVGCEETELCIRLRRLHTAGRILYDPAAEVRHLVTADRATWSYFRRRCYAEGRSKAVVASLAGAGSGLSSEREYTRSTLPRGVTRELRRGLIEPAGVARAATMVAGLVITACGFLSGRASRKDGLAAGTARYPVSAPIPEER